MAKVISSLPGSTGTLSRTSQLTNDGESGVSTYVELDDISTVATTGDYNNLINVPINFTPKVHTHNISDISGTKSEFNTSLTDGDFLFVGDVLDTPDATVTTKGILKLTGDLGGTADNPTTPTAIHKTGDEVKQGILTLSDGLKIVGNTTSTTATKVNVQENDGTINTISKSDLVNVVEVNDVPSLPLVGEVGKIYVVKNVNKIYRWNGTFYQELAGSDISGKEDIANKQNDLTPDGSNTKYPTVTAVNTGLATKANDNSVVHLAGAETITGKKTFSPTLTATANNEILVGLDISPTFNNGAFTGVKNIPIRMKTNTAWLSVSEPLLGSIAFHNSQTPTIQNCFFRSNGKSTVFNIPDSSGDMLFQRTTYSNLGAWYGATGNLVVSSAPTDDNINRLQVTGTISSGTTVLGNTPPIANNQLTRKDYVDTGLALKANLASPTFTGTPTAPTATAGANTTQVATTAFVTNGIATADSQNVKLTGNQTISGQKSFSLTGKIDMQTDNAFPAISVTALGSNGVSAAEFINNSSSSYSTALRLRTSPSGGVGNVTLSVLNSSPTGTGIVSNASNGGVSISSQSGNGDSYISNIAYGGTGRNYVGRNNGTETYSVDKTGSVTATQYKVSALNTAPASATATGTTGEIRITAGFIYVCIATNTWVRAALTTWI